MALVLLPAERGSVASASGIPSRVIVASISGPRGVTTSGPRGVTPSGPRDVTASGRRGRSDSDNSSDSLKNGRHMQV